MINQYIDIDEQLGKQANFFDPYGPNILHFKLNENLLSKLDNYIEYFLNDKNVQKEVEDTIIAHSPDYTNDEGHSQYNTISSGIMRSIPPHYDQKYDSLLGDIIYNICYEYVKAFITNVNTDISLRQFTFDEQPINLVDKELKNTEIKITDIWFVRMKEGDFHAMHDHILRATLSGGIYLRTPKVPFPQSAISWIHSGNSGLSFNNGSWGLQPDRGDVFVWPAWLSHHVYPFKGKDISREMISFNAKVEYIEEKI